jgi:hypothetical protein
MVHKRTHFTLDLYHQAYPIIARNRRDVSSNQRPIKEERVPRALFIWRGIGFIFFCFTTSTVWLLKSKSPRPRCPNCGWPFFTEAVRMEGTENLVAMCTRCHEVIRVSSEEKRESIVDRIITLVVSAFVGIFEIIVGALFGMDRPRAR